MADELEKRLEAEKPRNHLDMRHRLDPNGKRWGPVIDYKLSELRMTELMDDLCEEEMGRYTLWPRPDRPVLKPGKPVGIEPGWLRYKGEGHHKEARKVARGGGVKGKQEQNHLKLQLKTYCAGLLEEHEEELFEAIKEEAVQTRGVAAVLCHTITSACKGKPLPPVREAPAADAAEGAKGEL